MDTKASYSLTEGRDQFSGHQRSERDYLQEVDPKIVRISAFGDSFTLGAEVSNNETWEQQLENQAPHFEVVNFGVGGYGLDQAYLQYLQEGVAFHSDILVIGFMSENIYRNLNVFRPFYSSLYVKLYTKPRVAPGATAENRNTKREEKIESGRDE